MITTILVTIGIVYLISSIFVYFLANSNVIPSRRNKEYTINFGAELHKFQSKIDPDKYIAYWKAENGSSNKNVILLHGFTRTSEKLQKRAEIYWDMGYNLYFVDNLGHGYSSDLLYPSGYRYSRELKDLIQKENIEKPIIHGLSMGAIAASVIGQSEPEIPSAIVCEALAYHFNDLYKELLNYLDIPFWLFPWLEWLSKKLNWKQFEELGMDESDYKPTEVDIPMFLIHSDSDTLFDYKEHFQPMKEQLTQKNGYFKSWLAHSAGHTNMDQNDEYEYQLREFIQSVEKS